ncbi:MAG: tetratricopeptide repeat protein [Armatimonadota bacterium]
MSSRGVRVLTWMLAGLMGCAAASAAPASVEGVHWPEEWVMFGPVGWNEAELAPEHLREIPDSLRLGGEEYTGRRVEFDGGRIDLSALLGGHERRDTVYLFGDVRAERAVEVPIGAAADWWMAWWLNGEPLYDTLETGNFGQDFSVGAHTFKAPLRKGGNVLAVRVSGGRDGFLLAAGIPSEQRWDTLLQATREEQRRSELSDLIGQAASAREEGRLSRERRLLREALEVAKPGGHVELSLRLRLGESHEADGRPERARRVYEQLLHGDLPSWARPVVHRRLAQALHATGADSAARQAYAELTEMPDVHPLTLAAARKALAELTRR